MVHRWGQSPGRQRETQTKTREPCRRASIWWDAEDSQAAPRIWPMVLGHIGGQARFLFLTRCASYFPPTVPARRSGTSLRHGITPQHPARSRVQVQLSERKPGLFLPLTARYCCPPLAALALHSSPSVTTRVIDKHAGAVTAHPSLLPRHRGNTPPLSLSSVASLLPPGAKNP